MTKKTFYNFLLAAVCCVLPGAALVVWPVASISVFCYVVGAVATAYGLYHVYRFITRREERHVRISLVAGVIALALGLCLFLKPDALGSVLPVILGLFLVFGGVVKLQAASDVKKEGYPKWGILFLLALLIVALGVTVICNPFRTADVLTVFTGASLLADGIINIWNAAVVRRLLRGPKKSADRTEDGNPPEKAAAAADGNPPEKAAAADGNPPEKAAAAAGTDAGEPPDAGPESPAVPAEESGPAGG